MDQHHIQVRLTALFRGNKAGDRIWATPGLAEQLQRAGIAVQETEEPAPPARPPSAIERAVFTSAAEIR